MSWDGFLSRLNPLVSALLRSPLHFLVSPGLLLLTVTGRRSGRRYAIPVGYQQDEANRRELTVMVSEAAKKQWWRNYREPGPVELHLRGRLQRGRAELVAPGSEEFRRRTERTLQRMPWMGRVFGVAYRKGRPLDPAQLETLGRRIAVVRIELDGPGEG